MRTSLLRKCAVATRTLPSLHGPARLNRLDGARYRVAGGGPYARGIVSTYPLQAGQRGAHQPPRHVSESGTQRDPAQKHTQPHHGTPRHPMATPPPVRGEPDAAHHGHGRGPASTARDTPTTRRTAVTGNRDDPSHQSQMHARPPTGRRGPRQGPAARQRQHTRVDDSGGTGGSRGGVANRGRTRTRTVKLPASVHPIARMFRLGADVEDATGTMVVWPSGMKKSLWADVPGFKSLRHREAAHPDSAEARVQTTTPVEFVRLRWSDMPTVDEFLGLRVNVRVVGQETDAHEARDRLQGLSHQPDASKKVVFPVGTLTDALLEEIASVAGVSVSVLTPPLRSQEAEGASSPMPSKTGPKVSAALRGDLLRVLYAERMVQVAASAWLLHERLRLNSPVNRGGKVRSPMEDLIQHATHCTKRKDFAGLQSVVEQAMKLGPLPAKMYDLLMYFLTHPDLSPDVAPHERVQRLLAIRDDMRAAGLPWEERNYSLAIRGLTAAGDYATAHSLLRDMPSTVSPHWRTFGPLIESPCADICSGTTGRTGDPLSPLSHCTDTGYHGDTGGNDAHTAEVVLEQAADLYDKAVGDLDFDLNPDVDTHLFAASAVLLQRTNAPEHASSSPTLAPSSGSPAVSISQAVGHMLLQWYRDRGQPLTDVNFEAATTWLGARPGWVCQPTTISDEGHCAVCGSALDTLELSSEERSELTAALEKQVRKGIPTRSVAKGNQNQMLDPARIAAELTRFDKWLDERGPVSVVIDGLNVGLTKDTPVGKYDEYGGAFSPLKLEAAIEAHRPDPDSPTHEGGRAAVIARHHVKRNADKRTAALVRQLEDAGELFLVPDNFQDDLFTVYAAIKNGMEVDLLANDLFRDLTLALRQDLDRYTMYVYSKWLRGHAKGFSLEPAALGRRGVVTQWRLVPRKQPVKYDAVVQSTHDERGWHIPSAPGDDWVCARPVE
eukprot:m.189155 g.189155  ORF g.189155 m.189155 type:complete len:950 (+) comp17662_c0_seq1:195-3044(+)